MSELISIGIEHTLLGWDHLLLVAGNVLLAGSPRRGAKVISVSVLGHSLALVAATLVENFGHSLGDGYVVLYPDDVTDTDLDQLRDLVESGDPAGVVAEGREDVTGQVTAVMVRQEITCETVHVVALRQFSRAWMESIGATSW